MAGEKKRKDKTKSTLSSMQEVTYSREFKMADRAGGYTDSRKH
ncbi:YfhE family protein [Cytobacillus gottheilii]|nr:YfhE family protein [Cytobacillus gottheilii]